MDLSPYLPAIISTFAYMVASLNVQRHVFMPAPIPRAIWMVVSFVSLMALVQTDAGHVSKYLAAGLFVGSVVLFLFSIKRKRLKMTRANLLAIIGTVICLMLWRFTGNPFIALVAILSTDAIAILLNMLKTWKNPYFEDITFWAVLFTASLTSLVYLLDSPSVSTAGFMFVSYFCVSQFLMLMTILIRLIIIEATMPRKALQRLRAASSR